jgi:hypothetical protein
LPESLASLARRSAFEIRDERFRFDKEELLKRVDRALRAPEATPVDAEPAPPPAETEAPPDEPGPVVAEKTLEQESFRLVMEFQVASAPSAVLAQVTRALEAVAEKTGEGETFSTFLFGSPWIARVKGIPLSKAEELPVRLMLAARPAGSDGVLTATATADMQGWRTLPFGKKYKVALDLALGHVRGALQGEGLP